MNIARLYLDGAYTERTQIGSIPEEFASIVNIGSRVLVSTKNNKEHIGFIRNVSESTDGEEASLQIIDVFDEGKPMIREPLFQLAEWMASYYLVSIGAVLQTLIPAALRIEPREIVSLVPFSLAVKEATIVKTELRRKILSELEKESPLTIRQLQRRTGSKSLRLALKELQRIGEVMITEEHYRSAKPKYKSAYRLPTHPKVSKNESLPQKKRSAVAEAVLKRFAELGHPTLTAEEVGASPAVLKTLVKRGDLEVIHIEVTRESLSGFIEEKKHITLSPTQQHVVNTVQDAMQRSVFFPSLLHGVTGSGKTWVYIEALRSALAQGKTAIVLVPEISLTPQTAARFRAEFGDTIRVLHSAMSDGEKHDAWVSFRDGKSRIALGARSAVFAPLENIGLIIVDEEHETSYKQDKPAPRYNARDVAIMRAKLEQAVCLLGSATPAIESYHNARNGKYTYFSLPTRADNAQMPDLKLIWMSKEKKVTPGISKTLFDEITKRLDRNEQIILFQNRRGFSGAVSCYDCGHIHTCQACNVPLVYHRKQHHLQCHYCGAITPMRRICARCSSPQLLFKNSGTEKIETELEALFPHENILRMDLDSTSKKGSHAKILTEFRERKSRLLLGTQMIAKGLDFPNVTLVGVLSADIGLGIPDFRASERLYSLLTQVAGRAGRSDKRGEVYLQVFDLHHPVFAHFLHSDYLRFYEAEADVRHQLHYPPFSRLVKIEFSGEVENHVKIIAERVTEELSEAYRGMPFEWLGPAPAVIEKVNHRYRYQLLVKQFGDRRLDKQTVLGMIRHYHDRAPWHVSIIIDVDPQSMM